MNLENKSLFSQTIALIILSVVCVILTVGIALFVGSYNTTFFNFENLNFANMVPVLIIGGFVSCVVIGIAVLFVSRSIFIKVKNYLSDDGGNEK